VVSAATYAAHASAPQDTAVALSHVTAIPNQRHAAPDTALLTGWTASYSQDPLFSHSETPGWMFHLRERILAWLVYICRVYTWGGTSDADVCHTLSPGLPSAYWAANSDACRTMLWYSLRLRSEVLLHFMCCIAITVFAYLFIHACYTRMKTMLCGAVRCCHVQNPRHGAYRQNTPRFTMQRRTTRYTVSDVHVNREARTTHQAVGTSDTEPMDRVHE